jgi:hypothetical protein
LAIDIDRTATSKNAHKGIFAFDPRMRVVRLLRSKDAQPCSRIYYLI